MNKETAAILLESLLERLECDSAMVSSYERQALRLAVQTLKEDAEPALPEPPITPPELPLLDPETPNPPLITLDLSSIEREETADNVLMCLDFGTAMSKAFASDFSYFSLRKQHMDLELGVAAGREGYTLPSSVFIADNGKAYFGFEAIEKSEGIAVDSDRKRLDSIKSWISYEGTLDGEANTLSKAENPSGVKLTKGNLLLIYLAYFTDMAEKALKDYMDEPKYVKRRYARPCWAEERVKGKDKLMRQMLAEAQILADTFSGRWVGGIDVVELKAAVEQIKELDRQPDYLIAEGVPEPVAVAAGAIANSENIRDAYMVVDAGAGTTDFGLFIATRASQDEEFGVFQIFKSIRGLPLAGDSVDGLLREFIVKKEAINRNDRSDRLILADLSRRIRSFKEILFKNEELEYTLSKDRIGKVQLDDFLADETVVNFRRVVELGFKGVLEAVDKSWLPLLDRGGLNVVLTGGSSSLPMMRALGEGFIHVKGHPIKRRLINPKPYWLDDMPNELLVVYPQLAVAIGGTAKTMPETKDAPDRFLG